MKHLFTDPFDASWIEKYKAAMGEKEFHSYKNKVWRHLMNINVGEVITISDWCKPENYDLFYKIAQCFIMESKGAYLFRNNYTEIKHYHDANEMEREIAILRGKHQLKIAHANGGGTAGGKGGTPVISAPPPQI